MILQSERKNNMTTWFRRENIKTCRILEIKYCNASDLDSWFLQRISFWVKFLATGQTLNWRFSNVADIAEKFAFKRSRFDFFHSVKSTNFAFCVLFWKTWLWNKEFETCQVLIQLFDHASDLELIVSGCVSFWVYFFCSLPKFHAFIKIVQVPVLF